LSKVRVDNSAIKRVAVFSRGDPLGDGLFKIPFIQSLRATFPNAEICWVTSRRSAYTGPIAELVAPYLDRIVSETGITESTWDAIIPKRPSLGPIDIAIDTQTVVSRTIAIRRALPAKIFLSASTNYALSSIRPPGNNIFRSTKPKHLVDHLMVLLSLAANGKPTLDMKPPAIAERFTDLAASLLPRGKTYVGFAPIPLKNSTN
jgi:ADP-heptose:LPS heptosyltransferase